MTPVRFKFLTPTGVPIANHPFYVTLNKAAFHSQLDGFVHPEIIEALTDDQGEALLSLFPANKPYYVTMDVDEMIDGSDCSAALRFRIAVPDLPTEVWANDLVVTDPIFSQAWDAEAIEVIMQAKAAAAASASAAKASEIAAAASEVAAEVSATAAAASEGVATQKAAEADASAVAAAGSATDAQDSAAAAAASQLAAGTSETNAAASAAAALVSQNAAAASATTANEAATAALASETNAAASMTAAAGSATAAGVSAAAALASQNAADGSATNAATAETNAKAWATNPEDVPVAGAEYSSMHWAKKALAAASVVTGSLIDGGSVDLSGGAYPAMPDFSTFWKVIVGGTVAGADGDTYGIGDTLVYSKPLHVFYKIDNTENVSSVNGKTGVVNLVKADVGLSNVDNTSDAGKPVSTAQQAALDSKQNLNQNLTGLSSVASAVDRIPIFSGNGGQMTHLPAGASGKQLVSAVTWDNVRTLIEYTRPVATSLKETGSFDDFLAAGWSSQLFNNGLANSPNIVRGVLEVVPYWYVHNTYFSDAGTGLIQVAYPYSVSANDKGSICWRHRYSGVWGTWQRSLTRADVTSTSSDSGVGKLLKNGDWGVGGVAVTLAATSLNTVTISGKYYVGDFAGSSNLPEAQNGYLEVSAQSSLYILQEFTGVTSGNRYARRMVNGTWQGWVLQVQRGSFGVGTPIIVNDPNTALTPGEYSVQNGVNTPTVSGWYDMKVYATNQEVTQVLYEIGSNRYLTYMRLRNGTSMTWTPWQCMTPIGIHQIWTDVGAVRSAGTTYTNTTGRPIMLQIAAQATAVGNYFVISVDGKGLGYTNSAYAVGAILACSAIVPPGAQYVLINSAGVALSGPSWYELR